MLRTIPLLMLASLVAACNETDKPPQPAANEWVILYSPAMPSGTPGNSFTFPAGLVHEDGVHYVVKAAPPVTLGQTITMSFSLDGSGTLKPTQGDPPGRVRLFMQRAGDDMTGAGAMVHYRWWRRGLSWLRRGDYYKSVFR